MKSQIKKTVSVILLTVILAFAFLFSGCDLIDKINSFLGKSDSQESDNGNQDGNQNGEDDVHNHSLKHFDAKNSTCNAKGNVEYWYCSGCGKYFADEAAAREVSSEACFSDYAEHHYVGNVCSVCGDVKLESGNLTELSFGTYGYESLSENQKTFYERMDEAAKKFHSSGDAETTEDSKNNRYYTLARKEGTTAETKYFTYSDLGLSEEEASNAFRAYRADHPLYYWLTSSYLVSGASSNGEDAEWLIPVVWDEYALESKRTFVNELLYTKIIGFRAASDEHDDAYHKALAYHDAVIRAVDYAYSGANVAEDALWAHSILGVFLNGERCGADIIDGVVCEGYAKSFQLLLNLSGVNNVYVTGYGETGDGKGENHAWNLAMIEGKYYWFDLTWDDQPTNPNGIIYNYFCASSSDTEFTDSHLENRTANASGVLYDNKLYDLPTNLIANNKYEGEGALDTLYSDSSENAEYVVCGYNALRLHSYRGEGEVNVSASKNFGGREYAVQVIGNLDTRLIDCVFKGAITKVNVPASVRFIYEVAFNNASLREINVAAENKFYTSEGGVLYTKNKYALVAYPVAREGESYAVSEATKAIMGYSFARCGLSARNLKTLTVNEGTYFIKSLGVGYLDSAAAFAKSNVTYEYAASSQELKNQSGIENVSN